MKVLETKISDLTHDGRGVARVDGKATFVAGGLPGELVRARIVAKHRQYDDAEVVEVLEASPDRVVPACAHFGVCGGCALQHLAPPAQLAAKQHMLLESLKRIGDVEPGEVLPPLFGDPWGYRRRGRLSVRHVEKKGRVLVGFREQNGRYVADVSRCPVLHPAVGERIAELAALIDTMDGKRTLPQIEIAVGDGLAALVVRHLEPLTDADTARWIEFSKRAELAIFLQPGGLDSVHALHPADAKLHFTLPSYELDIAFDPLDFVQVNGAMNARMIDHAVGLLDPQPTDRVLDLFCGLGNFTLPLARRAAAVAGVEGDAKLIARARANAGRNGLTNVEFHVADLAQDQRHAPWAAADYDLLLLDPARAGADKVLDYLPRKSVRRVVYVSCHPGTLARDAGILVQKHGLRLRAAGVMDMFPHTAHVESIAVFDRK